MGEFSTSEATGKSPARLLPSLGVQVVFFCYTDFEMTQKIYFSIDGQKSLEDFFKDNHAIQCKKCKCDLDRFARCLCGCCPHFPPEYLTGGESSFTCLACFNTVDLKTWIVSNLERYSKIDV